MQPLSTYITLRRFNNVLTGVIVVFALYIALIPFMPSLSWWVQHEAPVISSPPRTSIQTPAAIPSEPTLVIPAIGLNTGIYEGPTKYTLRKGVWHRPNSSTPDKGGNTVLAGHRFTYSDPAVFYHLDKVKKDDPITLYWQGKQYDYKVSNILTVQPTAIEIEAPTKQSLLTIYTCTPLWSSKYRLVLQATPITERSAQ